MADYEALVAITEMNEQIVTLTVNYRSQLVANGFPEDMALEMAVDYHRAIIKAILGSLGGNG